MRTNEIQFGGRNYVCRIVKANDGDCPDHLVGCLAARWFQ